MQVTLDLDKLLDEGKITRQEFEKLKSLASHSTGTLAFNILVGFGVIAISGALLALSPNVSTAIAIGACVSLSGVFLSLLVSDSWAILANINLLAGGLLLGGAIVKQGNGSEVSFLIVTALFGVAATIARSGLLAALSILALSSSLGARTGYFHASYFLGIQQPLLTVVVFSVLAITLFWISNISRPAYERLLIIAARTSVFLVNFGFWIGSLWGDHNRKREVVVPDWGFSIAWAVALLCTGIWAWRANRRWVVNCVAVFGAIHFYTQWFERLGAQPESILIAGLLAVGFALALRFINRSGVLKA